MVDKITSPITPLGEIDKINEIIDELDNIDPLPSQTGQSGKYLTTNGTAPSWAEVQSLPSQTGKAGLYLQTDGTDASWEGVPGRNIGEIVSSTIPLTDAGLHLLDGSLIQGSGIYSAFVDYIAGLDLTANYFCTEAEWQASVTQYGVCGKFVYDSTNNTVRLPKYNSKIYTGGGTAPVVGNGMTLGLTDGTDIIAPYGQNYGIFRPMPNAPIPYGSNTTTAGSANNVTSNITLGITLDPTKSGIEAQLSDITTSLDGYYYIVVATSTKTDIEVDIDEIATDLNSKADVDLSNISASQSAKNEIVSWGMPDYTNGIVISVANNSETSYTCPSKGVVIVNVTSGGNASSAYIKINDITVGMDRSWSGNNLNVCNAYLTVNNGDVIKARSSMDGGYSTDFSFIKFFPMEGAN